jgi:hypothetical protein
MPTVSPFLTSRETFSSARTVPERVRNSSDRSFTASSGFVASSWRIRLAVFDRLSFMA